MKTAILLSAIAVFVLLSSWTANADTIVFSSRASFNLALDAQPSFVKTVEAWDTYPALTIFSNGSTVNGITYNVSNGQAQVVSTGISLSPPNNLYQTAGVNFRPLDDTFTFRFEQPISAFGITFSSTFATANGSYVLTTDLGDMVPSFFDPVFPGFGLGGFAGFISDRPFNRVTVSSTVNALYGMDDLTFARLPEPSILTLSCIGVLSVVALYRRSQF